MAAAKMHVAYTALNGAFWRENAEKCMCKNPIFTAKRDKTGVFLRAVDKMHAA